MSVENNKLIKYKSKSAITLISLVVTIIVLLILAGVAVSTLTGENGVITKAIEAAFRSEMSEMRDNVDLELINCEMYGETVDEKFEQVKFEDAKKWDEYLKLEVIYYGEYDLDYGVTKLSRDYIKSYGDSILESNTEEQEGTKYVRNLYFVDKSIYLLGRENVKTKCGNTVACYNLERTICDLIRSIKRLNEHDVNIMIKRYLKDPNCNLKRLYEYAEKMGIYDEVYGRINKDING